MTCKPDARARPDCCSLAVAFHFSTTLINSHQLETKIPLRKRRCFSKFLRFRNGINNVHLYGRELRNIRWFLENSKLLAASQFTDHVIKPLKLG